MIVACHDGNAESWGYFLLGASVVLNKSSDYFEHIRGVSVNDEHAQIANLISLPRHRRTQLLFKPGRKPKSRTLIRLALHSDLTLHNGRQVHADCET